MRWMAFLLLICLSAAAASAGQPREKQRSLVRLLQSSGSGSAATTATGSSSGSTATTATGSSGTATTATGSGSGSAATTATGSGSGGTATTATGSSGTATTTGSGSGTATMTTSSGSNKCDQCNSCQCDDNCDCIATASSMQESPRPIDTGFPYNGPCLQDGAVCDVKIPTGPLVPGGSIPVTPSCIHCCKAATFWADATHHCGVEPCWPDGTVCLAGTTCSQCCNTARDALGTKCGGNCWGAGTVCGAGTTCNYCCNGYSWQLSKFFTACN
ncbi:hypothetical protein JKP88DRAFT_373 [Tribonema minus]|uniref:Uncharacterized protein n=1 Tax=Tribonema minus TaxID=303371 RepID=A0A835ZH35_9STRA|nr:hypothetical protein JKP88DRAFT_373 [Tribonema minus]